MTEITGFSEIFSDCPALTTVVIRDGVTSIGEYAFSGCTSLTSIDLPESLTSIGYEVFNGCTSLAFLTCRAEKAPKCGYTVFYDVPTSEATLYVPESAIDNYKKAGQWSDFAKILPIGQEEILVEYALKAGWNTIVLPAGITDPETFGTGVKAYAFTDAVDGTLSFSTVNRMEAHKPYIIYAPEAFDFSFTTDDDAPSDLSVEHGGITFRGTYEDIDAPYMEGKYGITDDARIRKGTDKASLKAYHAYFEVAPGAEIKAISFDGNDATGIIEIADIRQQPVYNLAGQRIQAAQKGLNIIGGNKVLY